MTETATATPSRARRMIRSTAATLAATPAFVARHWKAHALVGAAALVTASAAGAADGSSAGWETFVPLPDYARGGGQTLVESVPIERYMIDHAVDANPLNTITRAGNELAGAIFSIGTFIAWILIVVIQWILGTSTIAGDALQVTDLLGAVTAETTAWLFPTCLALAGVGLWVSHQRDRSGASGLITLLVLAIAALGFSIAPQAYVSGVENVRGAGQSLVAGMMPDTNGENAKPFAYGSADFSGNTTDEMFARKTTDALWRAGVATPWCMVEFGSLPVCEKYGPAMLDIADRDQRTDDVIKKQMFSDDSIGGKDGEAGQWIHGEKWPQRLGMAVLALVVAGLLLFMAARLVWKALIAFLQALLLLVLGAVFVTVGMIPGMPREWLKSWGGAFAGALLSTVTSMLLLVVSMGAMTGALANSNLSWAQSYALALIVLAAASGLSTILDRAVSYATGDMPGGGMGRTISRVMRTMLLRRMLSGGRGRAGAKGAAAAGAAGKSGASGRSGANAGPRRRGMDTVNKRMAALRRTGQGAGSGTVDRSTSTYSRADRAMTASTARAATAAGTPVAAPSAARAAKVSRAAEGSHAPRSTPAQARDRKAERLNQRQAAQAPATVKDRPRNAQQEYQAAKADLIAAREGRQSTVAPAPGSHSGRAAREQAQTTAQQPRVRAEAPATSAPARGSHAVSATPVQARERKAERIAARQANPAPRAEAAPQQRPRPEAAPAPHVEAAPAPRVEAAPASRTESKRSKPQPEPRIERKTDSRLDRRSGLRGGPQTLAPNPRRKPQPATIRRRPRPFRKDR